MSKAEALALVLVVMLTLAVCHLVADIDEWLKGATTVQEP